MTGCTGKMWAYLLALLVPAVPATPCRAQETAPARVELVVEGVQGELLENVHALLALARNRDSPQLTAALIQRLHEKAPSQIRRALEPFGYYRPEIRSALQPPDAAHPVWRARYQIQVGEPVKVGTLNLTLAGEGRKDPLLDPVLRAFPLARGDTLEHRRYEQGKRELLRGTRRAGYLQARLARSRVRVALESLRADVIIHLDTGPLHRFGPVTFEQEGFDRAYLERFVPFRPGQRFDPADVTRMRHALGASGHFEQVAIERLPAQGETHLTPLRVHLEPFKPNRYRVRFGWGTDTGLGLHGDWHRRYLWGSGHQMSAGAVLVQERAKFVADLNYSLPMDPLDGSRIELFARHQGKDLSYEDVELEDGGMTRILNNTLGLRLPRPRRLWGGLALQERIGLTWLTESYDVFEVLFAHQPQVAQDFIEEVLGERRAILAPSFNALVPSVEWTYRSRNDALYATRGDLLQLELKGALRGLASNLSFWQARLRGAHIRPLLGRDRLILRTDLAYTAAQSEQLLGITFNQLPELYEFRTGGDRSVRGYGYETLLPEDSITGAKHLLVASVEYEKSLFQDWSAAVFLDLGNAVNDFSDLTLYQGVGAGVRWRSPVGLIRLDLALPLSKSEDDYRIHFSIGPEF
jgi:translocation and assembly module TamA